MRIRAAHARQLLTALLGLLGWAPLVQAQIVLSSGFINVQRLERGAQTTGAIRISNLSDTPQTAQLELGDIHEGAGNISAAGSSTRSIAALVSIPTLITLNPNETRDVTYTITVPPDANGTYVGVLILTPAGEQLEVTPLNATNPEQSAVTLHQVVRYAIEIIIDVASHARPELNFHTPSLDTTEAWVPRFHLSAHNRGERWAETVHYHFDLYHAQSGHHIASYAVARGRLFPGAEHHIAVELHDLPPGSYQLLVFADVNNDDLFAARYSLDVRPPAREPPTGSADAP